MSMATAINTLTLAQRLRGSGMPAEQAETVAQAIGESVTEALVTKPDLDLATQRLEHRIDTLDHKIDGIEGKLSARIDSLSGKVDQLKWMGGFLIALVLSIAGKTFFHF